MSYDVSTSLSDSLHSHKSFLNSLYMQLLHLWPVVPTLEPRGYGEGKQFIILQLKPSPLLPCVSAGPPSQVFFSLSPPCHHWGEAERLVGRGLGASPFFRMGRGSSDALPREWALVENSLDIFHTITLSFFLPESVGVCFWLFHWGNLVGFLELKPRRRGLDLGLGHSGLSISPARQTLAACQTLNLGCLFPKAHHQRSLGLSCWLEKEMATCSSILA